MSPTILVTGASGFIGKHVLDELAKAQISVLAMVGPKEPVTPREGVHFFQANFHQTDQLAPLFEKYAIDQVLHLAWNAQPGKFWTAPDNLDWVASTLRFARLCQEKSVKRFVGVGTCAEYDWTVAGRCQEMKTPLSPNTLYGQSKHACHEILEKFFHNQGISFAWARIFFLYGPGEHPDRVIPYVIRRLIQNENALLSEGTQVRDFMDVRDVAGALVALLRNNFCGPVNIGSGQGFPLKEILGKIGEQLGKKELLDFGNKPTSPGEPTLLVADNRLLIEEVGFSPQITLEDGLSNCIQWWSNHPS